MGSIFNSAARQQDAGGSLTPEVLADAIKAIEENHDVDPCKLGKHLISSASKRRGYGICVECRSPVGDWPYTPYESQILDG